MVVGKSGFVVGRNNGWFCDGEDDVNANNTDGTDDTDDPTDGIQDDDGCTFDGVTDNDR